MGTVEIGDRRVRERDQEGLRVARVGVTRVRSDLRQIGGHRGDRRSASARERPRGAVLCKRDQGTGKRARHGVAEVGTMRKRAETVRKRESRDSERGARVLENGLRKYFP